ncbi:MAG: response regulator [Gammaproteobacteria bacterium]|nr:response regulator [Gammaproteobacteria bacterium]
MLSRCVPCFYYPTKVLFVDDNSNYLNNIVLTLDKKIRAETSLDPKKIANELMDKKDFCFYSQYLNGYEEVETSDGLSCRAVGVNFSKIQQAISLPQKNNQVSVLLVDYAMPGMDGVSFFKLLKNSPIKKVMVTGEADYNIAVTAFNEGIIDRFIVKDDPDFFNKINNTIFEMQKKYFQEMSSALIGNLNANSQFSLTDSLVHDFIYRLIDEKKIVEFYLVDESGSLLLRDETGRFSWLVIKTEKEMLDYHDVANEFGGASTITNQLKEKKVIPFFVTEEDWRIPVDQWGPYLHPASCLKGCETYYYAVVEK